MRRFAAVAAAFALVGCVDAGYDADDLRDALRSADTPGLMSMSDDDLMTFAEDLCDFAGDHNSAESFVWQAVTSGAFDDMDAAWVGDIFGRTIRVACPDVWERWS